MYSFDRSAPLYRQTIRELNLGVYKDVISCSSSTSVAQGTTAQWMRCSAFPAGKQEHLVDSGHRGQRAEEDEGQHRVDARADEGDSQRALAAAAGQVSAVGRGGNERPGDYFDAAESAGDAERREGESGESGESGDAGNRGGGRSVAIAIPIAICIGVRSVETHRKGTRRERK